MTLQQLEYVIALDNHRHFVSAAEHCFVTQPTLTMQLKKLEDEIGIVIFDRSKKPLRPTSAGELVIAKSREILREVNQLKELVSDEKESLSGTYKVGIIPTLASTILPILLPKFLSEHPKITLDIHEMKSSDIIKQLQNDTLDIALMVTPTEEHNIREIPLFYEPFLLYHNEEPSFKQKQFIEPKDINRKKLLLLSEGHCFRNQMLNICGGNNDNTSQFIYKSGSIETLKRMVQKGMGYTLVPQLSVDQTETRHCLTFKDPKPVREVSIVTHKSFAKELLLEELRKTVLMEVPDNLQKNERYFRVKWK